MAKILLCWVFSIICLVVRVVPSFSGWEIAEDCGDTANILGVAFATQKNGAAVSEDGNRIMYSNDGGITWKPAKVDVDVSKHNLFDVVFSDTQTGWVVGSYDTSNPPGKRLSNLLKTMDSGASWVNQPLPDYIILGNPFRVWFDKSGNGWILPYGGHAIFRTSDEGKTWQQLIFREAHPTIKSSAGWIHMGWHIFDSKHLIICGQMGILIETKDGGEIWTAIETGFSDLKVEGLEDLYFSDEKNGWAVGEKGIILHTADGGKTWEKQNSGVPNALERVQFINGKIGYAVGPAIYSAGASADRYGVLLYTEDGGKNWKSVNPTTATLRGLFFLDAKHGWVVGGRGGSGSEPKVMILRYVED